MRPCVVVQLTSTANHEATSLNFGRSAACQAIHDSKNDLVQAMSIRRPVAPLPPLFLPLRACPYRIGWNLLGFSHLQPSKLSCPFHLLPYPTGPSRVFLLPSLASSLALAPRRGWHRRARISGASEYDGHIEPSCYHPLASSLPLVAAVGVQRFAAGSSGGLFHMLQLVY